VSLFIIFICWNHLALLLPSCTKPNTAKQWDFMDGHLLIMKNTARALTRKEISAKSLIRKCVHAPRFFAGLLWLWSIKKTYAAEGNYTRKFVASEDVRWLLGLGGLKIKSGDVCNA
jgi:hypothetical protein